MRSDVPFFRRHVRFFISSIVSLSTIAFLFFFFRSQVFRLTSVEVKNANGSADAIFKHIESRLTPKLQKFKGLYLWEVPLSQVVDVATSVGWIEKMEVRRKFPLGIEIEITPFEPPLVWASENGEFLPLAKNGSLLPPTPLNLLKDSIIVRGPAFKNSLQLRQKAVEIQSQIPRSDAFDSQYISEITYDPKEGFALEMSNGISKIVLGEGDFAKKLQNVQQVLRYLKSKEYLAETIDARIHRKVVVRLKSRPKPAIL